MMARSAPRGRARRLRRIRAQPSSQIRAFQVSSPIRRGGAKRFDGNRHSTFRRSPPSKIRDEPLGIPQLMHCVACPCVGQVEVENLPGRQTAARSTDAQPRGSEPPSAVAGLERSTRFAGSGSCSWPGFTPGLWQVRCDGREPFGTAVGQPARRRRSGPSRSSHSSNSGAGRRPSVCRRKWAS